MKLCIIADLHLPYNQNAPQYRAFDFALNDAQKKGADLLIFAGDETADGDRNASKAFIKRVKKCGIPFLVIYGNSDLRCGDRPAFSPLKTVTKFKGFSIIMLNDGERSVTEKELEALEKAGENDLVFMHHPMEALKDPYREKMLEWRSRHSEVRLFYAHLHKIGFEGNTVSLPALDPDKNIGENPCVLYYDTDSKTFEKAHYFRPMPVGFFDRCGISCYRTLEDITYSAEHRLASLELRPNVTECDRAELIEKISLWREAGGRNLSVHFPDAVWNGTELTGKEKLAEFAALANELHADRITIHVPRANADKIQKDGVSDIIAQFYAELFDLLPENCTAGIENLHMKESDRNRGTRPFGCIPEDCIDFLNRVKKYTRHTIGINLDIGHARNNAPYSQKYTLGAWYAEVGKYCVGYHIHQVTSDENGFENHMPITEHYGRLISLSSFYDGLTNGTLNSAPVILEIRPLGGAAKTVEFFEKEKSRKVHDIHSHTYHSFCGRDEPQRLVDTAIANGISVLGICDHSYGIGENKAGYLTEIRELAEKNKDRIKILCGIEIPSLPRVFDFKDFDFSEIADYDYCLIEHIDQTDSVIGEKFLEFTNLLGIPCGIAHTDMFKYCEIFGFDPEDYFRKLAEKKIFWEMNMSYDSIHGYRKHEYVERFIQSEEEQDIVRRSGLRLSIGFDSHRCEDYDGARVHAANDFLIEKKLPSVDGYLF